MASLREIREFLLPRVAERDEGFRAEVERLGRRALRIIGLVEIVMPMLGVVAYYAALGLAAGGLAQLWYVLAGVILGICTCWSAGTFWGGQHSRGIAVFSGFLMVVILTLTQVYLLSGGYAPRIIGSIGILSVLLVGIAILPARPHYIFVLGSAASLFHAGSLKLAVSAGWIPASSVYDEELASLPVLVVLCTALMAVSYQRLHSSYAAHQRALRASEELRRAESRTLIAESAASMGRFAAAVSHELNSPLGAMKSAAESLQMLAPRFLDAQVGERQRLSELMENLCRNVSGSADRMAGIVGRMQRFTNLDRAEIQSVDLNQLLLDVAALVEARASQQVTIETELGPPRLVPCRPQPLSAVFSGLLDKAVENAGDNGRVRLTTTYAGATVQVSVADDGPAIHMEKLVRLFDPEFHVSERRVTTGNWNLFSARRLILEQGGDIRVESREGVGTTFLVTLPFAAEPT